MLARLLASDATAVRVARAFFVSLLTLFTVTATTTLPALAAGTPYGGGAYDTGTYDNTGTANSLPGATTPSNATATGGTPTAPPSTPSRIPGSTTPQSQAATTIAPSNSNTSLWLYGGISLILLAAVVSLWLLIKRHKRNPF